MLVFLYTNKLHAIHSFFTHHYFVLFQCFQFNKFEGYPDEHTLEKKSLEYIDKELFWSGKLIYHEENAYAKFIQVRVNWVQILNRQKWIVLS